MPDVKRINELLDEFHRAAATGKEKANFFFDLIDDAQGTYIGTDQEEHWTKAQFAAFAMPYFARGPAWDFNAVDRHVFFSADGTVAWFDEWLDTWMQGCRGSGVFVKSAAGVWKMEQYVLSMTMPTALLGDVQKEKAEVEARFLKGRAESPVMAGTPQSAHAFLNSWHRAVATADEQAVTDGLAPNAFAVSFYSDGYFADHRGIAQMLQDALCGGGEYDVVERHVYKTDDEQYVWFDELYDGSMQGYRGSGVLHKKGAAWCVQHYVLSLTVPNDMAKPLVPRKKEYEGEELSRKLAARNAQN